jgi:hypothetical protein
MIRQAVNDTADSYRKDGHTCPDFAQNAIANDIAAILREREDAR